MSYYLKKFWKANLIVIIFQALLHITQASFSLMSIQFAQAVIDLDLRRFIFWMTLTMIGWGVFQVLYALKERFRGQAIRKMNNAVRQDMAATLLQKDYQSYHGQDKGEYLSWFTSGVGQIEEKAWQSFFSLTYFTAQFLANIVVLSSLHWSFLPVALVSSVLMGIVPKLFDKKLESLGAACAKGQETAVSGMKDLLGGYDILRFFGRSARFGSGIDQASDQMEKPKYEQTYKSGVIYGILGMVNILSQLIVNCYIAALVFMGVLPISIFFGAGNLCGAISNGLNNLAYHRLCFSTAKPYFSRITVHAGDAQAAAPQGPEPVGEAITVEDLSFRYGEKPVLAHMDAVFQKGGKYALTGPSGCGKSTLLKLLLGWLPGYEGTIRFDGSDARDFTPEQLQQQMSYIAQDVFLFNTTIRDNITLGEAFTDEQMERALRSSALAGDLEAMPLGLDTPVCEEGGSLSGGQKQRVAIARALIHDRSILLVDEGTSALDQKNADIVEKSLLANPDLTLILVSHHLTPERKAQFTRVFDLQGGTVERKIA